MLREPRTSLLLHIVAGSEERVGGATGKGVLMENVPEGPEEEKSTLRNFLEKTEGKCASLGI